MRFSIAKTMLAALVAWGSLTALDISSAHAGIIITIGDSPLLSSAQIKRYMARHNQNQADGADDGRGKERDSDGFDKPAEREQSRPYANTPDYQAGHRTCQSTQTGKTERCPRPASPEVDGSGLPSEWSCFAIQPGVFYCDAAYFGAGADAGAGGYAGEGDFADDELAVLGCSGGTGSASWLLVVLALAGLGFARRKRRQDA